MIFRGWLNRKFASLCQPVPPVGWISAWIKTPELSITIYAISVTPRLPEFTPLHRFSVIHIVLEKWISF